MGEPQRARLADRYELSQLIAAGGMGRVWRGEDLLLGRPVAVKMLRSEYSGDPTFLARFRAEAYHAASLSHPNIAAVFDYGEVTAEDRTEPTLPYLVMELVEGEPLSTLLRRQGRLSTAMTLAVLGQAAAALGEAHRGGVVHRDVKPANLLIRRDGQVKVTDFGIAWSAGAMPLTGIGQVIGTAQYLSPEQAAGQLATPASDVYALAMVGYECLTGHPAFTGDNPVTVAVKQIREQPEPLPAELPGAVQALIGRALAKDPAERLPDGTAFAAAIGEAAAGRELTPVQGGDIDTVPSLLDTDAPAARQPSTAARQRLNRALVSLVAVLVGAALASLILHRLGDPGAASHAPAAVPGSGQSAAQAPTAPTPDILQPGLGDPPAQTQHQPTPAAQSMSPVHSTPGPQSTTGPQSMPAAQSTPGPVIAPQPMSTAQPTPTAVTGHHSGAPGHGGGQWPRSGTDGRN